MDFNYALTKVYNPTSRKYLKEVVSCYGNGNFRSAVNSLYAVVIVDIYLKLYDLANLLEDEKAQRFLDQLYDIQKNRHYESEWENKLIDLAKNTSILESTSLKETIDHLKDSRNISSHPSLNTNNGVVFLGTPDEYEVAHYMHVCFSELFMVPPRFLGSITSKFVDWLSEKKEDLMHDDKRLLKLYIKNYYLSHMDKAQIKRLCNDLFNFVFVKDNPDCNENRDINYQALCILVDEYEYCLNALIDQKESFKQINLKQSSDFLLDFAIMHNQIWQALPENQRESIKINSKDSLSKKLKLALIESDKKFSEELEKFNNEIKENGFISGDDDCVLDNALSINEMNLLKKVAKELGSQKEFYKFCILLFGTSNNYRQAGFYYRNLIESNLSDFKKTDKELVKLLYKTYSDNRQIKESYYVDNGAIIQLYNEAGVGNE